MNNGDFLPCIRELEAYKNKLNSCNENESSKKMRVHYQDEYDSLGRNITEQVQRQNKVPWVKVKYISGRLYIDPEKKNILRSMMLI